MNSAFHDPATFWGVFARPPRRALSIVVAEEGLWLLRQGWEEGHKGKGRRTKKKLGGRDGGGEGDRTGVELMQYVTVLNVII